MEIKKKGGDRKMIVFVVLVVAGVVSFVIKVAAYYKSGSIPDYWPDLIEKYALAQPIIEFNGGMN